MQYDKSKINQEQWLRTHQSLMEQGLEFWSGLDSTSDIIMMQYGDMMKEPLEFLVKFKSFMEKSQKKWIREQWKEDLQKNQNLKNKIHEKVGSVSMLNDFIDRISAWHERCQVEVMKDEKDVQIQEYKSLIRRCFQEVERMERQWDTSLRDSQKQKIIGKFQNAVWRELGVAPGKGARQMITPDMQRVLIEALHQWSDEDLAIKESRFKHKF